MDKNVIEKNVKEYLAERPYSEEYDSIYRVTDTKISPEDVWELVSVSLDRWYTEGERAKEFRKAIGRATSNRYVNLVNSGSSANLLAVTVAKDGFNSPDGGKVITCATAFPTTVAPIIQNKLIPLFVDINPYTLSYDTELIIQLLSRKDVVGMIMTHNLGFAHDVTNSWIWAKYFGKWYIEDCCDALGTTVGTHPVGKFGDISTLSFFPAHHITTGEGGSVQTNNSKLYRLMQQYANWGRDCWCEPGQNNTCNKRFEHKWDTNLPDGYDHKYTFTKIGYNLKMTDLQAALGLSQIKRLPEIVRKRQENYLRLLDIMKPYSHVLDVIDLPDGCSPFGFPIMTKNNRERTKLIALLESKNIRTRPLFSGNIVEHPMMENVEYEVAQPLVGSDLVMDRMFWIGCHPYVSEKNFQMLEDALKEYYG